MRPGSENYHILDKSLRQLQLKACFCLNNAEENKVHKLGICGKLTFSVYLSLSVP